MWAKLFGIFTLKCPRCRKGNLLVGHPYDLKKFNRVNEYCPHCQVHLKIEPSFYYGSMYVSYAVGVALSVATYVLIRLLFGEVSLKYHFATICVVLLGSMPYINAISKVIWAHFFFSYDASYKK